jgi:hypothetical protein
MAAPTSEQIRQFIEKQIELWNAFDHDAFFALYRDFCPGGFSFENPANSGIHKGWDALEAMWAQAAGKVRIDLHHLFVNGHEAASFVSNVFVDGDRPDIVTLETYHFNEDGSFHARYFQ